MNTTVSIKPFERTESDATVDLSGMPDFDEQLPCECIMRGDGCQHDGECERETDMYVRAVPCGHTRLFCRMCAERTKAKLKKYRRISKIPFVNALALCSKDFQQIKDVEIIPI